MIHFDCIKTDFLIFSKFNPKKILFPGEISNGLKKKLTVSPSPTYFAEKNKVKKLELVGGGVGTKCHFLD